MKAKSLISNKIPIFFGGGPKTRGAIFKGRNNKDHHTLGSILGFLLYGSYAHLRNWVI